MKYDLLIRKLFWRFSLPFFLLSTTWCWIIGFDFFQDPLFLISTVLMMPMLMIKTFELQDGIIEKQQQEFMDLSATDFLNFMEEFRKIPLGKYRGICKEAYRQEYFRRYQKDIFNKIPMFEPSTLIRKSN